MIMKSNVFSHIICILYNFGEYQTLNQLNKYFHGVYHICWAVEKNSDEWNIIPAFKEHSFIKRSAPVWIIIVRSVYIQIILQLRGEHVCRILPSFFLYLL